MHCVMLHAVVLLLAVLFAIVAQRGLSLELSSCMLGCHCCYCCFGHLPQRFELFRTPLMHHFSAQP